MALIAHALDAHRPAHRLRQQGRVDPGVAGIIAPVGARAQDPDPVHLVLRQPKRAGDPVAREMRLLRAGPQGGAVGPRVDDGAGRTHAGVRLERPLVYGFDDPRRSGESQVDLAVRDRHLALDDRCSADVIVECRHLGKGRCRFGPGDLEPLAACTASHSRSATTPRNPFSCTTRTPGVSRTEPSSTTTGTAPATGGRSMRPCSIPGTLMSVT